MKSKIDPIKLLTLLFVVFYLVMIFSKVIANTAHDCLLRTYFADRFILRAITCCTALCYYLHLRKKKEVNPVIVLSTNGLKLMLSTCLLQFMMCIAWLLLSNVKETLCGNSPKFLLHFSSRADFLYRGIIETTWLTAMLEELLFRGILETLLGKLKLSRLWVTCVGAVVFSLMHCNMHNNLFYFVMGVFLSHLYHKTNHIIYPTIAHGLHNLCAISIVYFSLEESLNLTINSLPIIMRTLLAIVALLAVYGYMIRSMGIVRSKKREKF